MPTQTVRWAFSWNPTANHVTYLEDQIENGQNSFEDGPSSTCLTRHTAFV